MRHDLRLALRRIHHARGFSICVVLILAAGVGAVAALASVLNALAFRTLNLPDASSLIGVRTVDAAGAGRNTALAALDRLRDANLPVDGWCGYNSGLDATESGGRVMESDFQAMIGDCQSVIGVTPVLGRWFTPDETPVSGAGKPVMVITHGYWRRMFDGAPDVLGRTVKIQSTSVTVIGVMPRRFTGFSQDVHADFVVPFNAHRPSTGASWFVGRLSPGHHIDQARAAIDAIWPTVLEAVVPEGPLRAQAMREWRGSVEPFSLGQSVLRRLYGEPIRRLAVLSAFLLLLVCLNIAGLMIARTAARAPEMAAMRALGAGTARIARPLLAECLVLVAAGTALGLPLAYAASASFTSLLPIGNVPWTITTTPDARVFTGAAAGVLVMTFAIALVPAWLATRRTAAPLATRTTSRAASRWAHVLLVTQVALTVVLVVTSGLIVRSFNGLRTVSRGYDPEHLLSLRLAANPGGYQGLDAPAYYRSLIEDVASTPGVDAAGLARYFGTISARMPEQPVAFAGSAADTSIATATNDYVSPGFFAAAGVPLLRGRDLQWTDLPPSDPAVVVSESLARMLASDGDVVGRVIRFGSSPATSQLRIVGVAGNVSMGNVRHGDVRMIYQSSLQFGQTSFATVHVRTAGSPSELAAPLTRTIAGLGREHILSVHAHDVLFTNSMVAERMGAFISAAAAAIALVVSCIGLFALLSHSVQQRTREIAIRVAVGAQPAAITRLIVRQALLVVWLGSSLGLPAAIGTTTLVRSLLFGVTPTDSAILAGSVLVLLAVAAAGALLPTLRAVRVDPAVALRAE